MFKPLLLNTEHPTESLCSSASTIISILCPISGLFLPHLQRYSKIMIPRLLENICFFKDRMLSAHACTRVCVCVSQDRSTNIAPRLWTQHPRNHGSIPIMGKNHLFSKVSRLILKPTQFPTQQVIGGGECFFSRE